MSLVRLAAGAGAGMTSIEEWEHGRRLPGADAIARLCAALSCTPNDLFSGLHE